MEVPLSGGVDEGELSVSGSAVNKPLPRLDCVGDNVLSLSLDVMVIRGTFGCVELAMAV